MSLHARVRTLISQAKTGQAIQTLQEALQGTDLENEITALAGRYQHLQQQIMRGGISQSDQNLENARITHAILSLLDSLPESGGQSGGGPADPPTDGGHAPAPGDRSSRPLFPAITGISLLVGIVLLMVFVPCPTDAQFFAFRIMLAAGAGGLAAVIPGFFTFKYKRSIQAGGALAVFALIYLLNPASFSGGGDCGPFDLTIFLEDAGGSTPLKNEGRLILRLGNDKREEAIDAEGSASFKQLPAQAAGDTVPVELDAPGWQFDNGKSSTQVALLGPSQTLVIQRDSALYCCISGFVRDPRNKPLPGVTLDILGLLDTTDKQGRFKLVIPVAKQAERYRLTATHPRYKLWDGTVYPATNKEKETEIVMQK